MDKSFFENLEQREKDHAVAHGLGEATAELVLMNTKVYTITKVVEAGDSWVHLDAEDVADDHKPVALVMPYHQISHVRFREPRRRAGAVGFKR